MPRRPRQRRHAGFGFRQWQPDSGSAQRFRHGRHSAGTQLALSNYTGCTGQHWTLTATSPLAITAGRQLPGVRLYPVSAAGTGFTVDLGSVSTPAATLVSVYNLQGQRLFQQAYSASQTKLLVTKELPVGLCLVRVPRGEALATQKLTVQ